MRDGSGSVGHFEFIAEEEAAEMIQQIELERRAARCKTTVQTVQLTATDSRRLILHEALLLNRFPLQNQSVLEKFPVYL